MKNVMVIQNVIWAQKIKVIAITLNPIYSCLIFDLGPKVNVKQMKTTKTASDGEVKLDGSP